MTDALRRALRLADWIRRLGTGGQQLIVRDPRASTERQAVLVD